MHCCHGYLTSCGRLLPCPYLWLLPTWGFLQLCEAQTFRALVQGSTSNNILHRKVQLVFASPETLFESRRWYTIGSQAAWRGVGCRLHPVDDLTNPLPQGRFLQSSCESSHYCLLYFQMGAITVHIDHMMITYSSLGVNYLLLSKIFGVFFHLKCFV